MEINKILKNRRIELNLTQLDVAKAVGVSEATVSRWESGNIANMKRSRIAALAQILQIKPGVIMGLEGENESKNENSSTIEKGIKIPVLGSVRAGIPLEAIEDIVDYEEITEVMARNGEYFGLLVKGDSMSPVFVDGDTVIVAKCTRKCTRNLVSEKEKAPDDSIIRGFTYISFSLVRCIPWPCRCR